MPKRKRVPKKARVNLSAVVANHAVAQLDPVAARELDSVFDKKQITALL